MGKKKKPLGIAAKAKIIKDWRSLVSHDDILKKHKLQARELYSVLYEFGFNPKARVCQFKCILSFAEQKEAVKRYTKEHETAVCDLASEYGMSRQGFFTMVRRWTNYRRYPRGPRIR